MGVKNLWGILSPTGEQLPLSAVAGETVAVDLATWLVDTQTLGLTHLTRPHLRNLMFRTLSVLNCGVLPVFVLEGDAPSLKWDTIQARNHRNNHGAAKMKDVSVTTGRRAHFKAVQKECGRMFDLLGLPWVQADGEAEATCAALSYHGVVQGVITQDSDVFLYGAKTVYRNFSGNHRKPTVEKYSLAVVEERLGLTREGLILLGLVLGCDYLPGGVAGVGPDTTLRFLQHLHHHTTDPLALMNSWVSHHDSEPVNLSSRKWKNGDEEELVAGLRARMRATPGFPFTEVVQEFQVTRRCPLIKQQWTRPDLEGLVEWCVDRLGWTAAYAAEKLVPAAAHWSLTHSSPLPSLQAVCVRGRRVRGGVARCTVNWHVQSRLLQDQHFSTVEPVHLLQASLPHLCQHLVHNTKAKKTGKKVKKENTEGGHQQLITDLLTVMPKKLSVQEDGELTATQQPTHAPQGHKPSSQQPNHSTKEDQLKSGIGRSQGGPHTKQVEVVSLLESESEEEDDSGWEEMENCHQALENFEGCQTELDRENDGENSDDSFVDQHDPEISLIIDEIVSMHLGDASVSHGKAAAKNIETNIKLGKLGAKARKNPSDERKSSKIRKDGSNETKSVKTRVHGTDDTEPVKPNKDEHSEELGSECRQDRLHAKAGQDKDEGRMTKGFHLHRGSTSQNLEDSTGEQEAEKDCCNTLSLLDRVTQKLARQREHELLLSTGAHLGSSESNSPNIITHCSDQEVGRVWKFECKKSLTEQLNHPDQTQPEKTDRTWSLDTEYIKPQGQQTLEYEESTGRLSGSSNYYPGCVTGNYTKNISLPDLQSEDENADYCTAPEVVLSEESSYIFGDTLNDVFINSAVDFPCSTNTLGNDSKVSVNTNTNSQHTLYASESIAGGEHFSEHPSINSPLSVAMEECQGGPQTNNHHSSDVFDDTLNDLLNTSSLNFHFSDDNCAVTDIKNSKPAVVSNFGCASELTQCSDSVEENYEHYKSSTPLSQNGKNVTVKVNSSCAVKMAKPSCVTVSPVSVADICKLKNLKISSGNFANFTDILKAKENEPGVLGLPPPESKTEASSTASKVDLNTASAARTVLSVRHKSNVEKKTVVDSFGYESKTRAVSNAATEREKSLVLHAGFCAPIVSPTGPSPGPSPQLSHWKGQQTGPSLSGHTKFPLLNIKKDEKINWDDCDGSTNIFSMQTMKKSGTCETWRHQQVLKELNSPISSMMSQQSTAKAQAGAVTLKTTAHPDQFSPCVNSLTLAERLKKRCKDQSIMKLLDSL